MANPFDQFDTIPTQGGLDISVRLKRDENGNIVGESAQGPSNPFDQFDVAQPIAQGRAPRDAREATPTREQMKAAYKEMAAGSLDRSGTASDVGLTVANALGRVNPFSADIRAAASYFGGIGGDMGVGANATSYQDALDRTRAIDDALTERRPVLSYGTQIAGGAALPAFGIAGNTARGGAALGAGYGAAYGAGSGDDLGDRAMKAATGGAVGGAAGGAIGALLGKVAGGAPAEPNAIVRAAERQGFSVPVGVASDSAIVRRAMHSISPVPGAAEKMQAARGDLVGGMQARLAQVADDFGMGSGPNVAARVGRNIEDRAAAESAAARGIAAVIDEAAAKRFDSAVSAARSEVSARADSAASVAARAIDAARDSARRSIGELSPQEAGSLIAERLKTADRAARTKKEMLYSAAGETSAAINVSAVKSVGTRVARALDDAGFVIDSHLAPAASRMLARVNDLSRLKIRNEVTPPRVPSASSGDEIAAISFKGIEQVRKSLNAFGRAASNDFDRAASKKIIAAFDEWVDDAFDTALHHGGDDALRAIKAARAANAEWRGLFGYNAKDDAGRILNRIATGEVTPNEVANWMMGATRLGAPGVASRLLSDIVAATNNDAQAIQAIRAGVWTRLSQATEGVSEKSGGKVANEIYEFLNGSGRSLANSLFSREQREVMKAYADVARRVEADLASIPKETKAKNSEIDRIAREFRPKPSEVGIGPMQELANNVLGRSGKTDEALFSAIDAYARSGARGDIQTLSRILSVAGAENSGALSGAIIRNMGIARNGQFSPDLYLSAWASYSPQARTLLFGASGPHRKALEDIAMVSLRLQGDAKAFGNSSGTARVGGWVGAASTATVEVGVYGVPIKTIAVVVGGNVLAKILANPATASSAAKWSRAYEIAVTKPSIGALSALNIASRNLASTASDKLGITVAADDFMLALTGPRLSHSQPDQKEQTSPNQ